MSKFKCNNCNLIFEKEALQKEFVDPIYGPCKINYSICPYCGNESSEYKRPIQKNKSIDFDSCNGRCSCCNINK